jgi:hypothetical protein
MADGFVVKLAQISRRGFFRKEQMKKKPGTTLVGKLRELLVVELQNDTSPKTGAEKRYLEFAKKTIAEVSDDEFMNIVFGKIEMPLDCDCATCGKYDNCDFRPLLCKDFVPKESE